MCNHHVFFMFHEFRGCPIQLCLSLHICLSMWRHCLQRERDERHPAASTRSQAGRALICWRFVRRMKSRRGAAKSFKARPSPPLVTRWHNACWEAPLAPSYAHLSTFQPRLAFSLSLWLCLCVCGMNVGFCGYPCVFGCLYGAVLNPCSPVHWAMLCVKLKPKTNTLSCTEAIISNAASLMLMKCLQFFSTSFPLWKYKKTSIALQLNSFMNMIYMISLLSRCSEEPTNGPQAMCTHAYMINRSITSISASLMWHHHIMSPPALIRSGYFHPGNCCKTCRTITHTRRLNTSQTLFDASVYKHGDSQSVLFQRTLMEGLQLSVADRHLGKRDS